MRPLTLELRSEEGRHDEMRGPYDDNDWAILGVLGALFAMCCGLIASVVWLVLRAVS